MLDAGGLIEIGNENMFGADVYVADSNHTFGPGVSPSQAPMQVGRVRIGSRCLGLARPLRARSWESRRSRWRIWLRSHVMCFYPAM